MSGVPLAAALRDARALRDLVHGSEELSSANRLRDVAVHTSFDAVIALDPGG